MAGIMANLPYFSQATQPKPKFKGQKNLLFLLITVGVVCLISFMTLPLSPALAEGPPPDRPEPPPGQSGGPPDRPQPPSGGGGDTSSGSPHHGTSSDLCNTVHGLTINWGYGYEPKVPVELNGPGWQALKLSDDNGAYASDCFEAGIALVNPVSPPWLRPLANNVAIRLGYWPSYEVNFGFYSGPTAPLPEVSPTMTVFPTGGRPGDTLTYTLYLTNTLVSPSTGPLTMTNVLLTDLLPTGLAPVTVTTSLGETEIWDNLVTISLDELSPGQTAVISLTTLIQQPTITKAQTITDSVIINQASLIYPGHITAQTPPIPAEISANNP
jgi:uncharacterized repeat protein (TIGR01451 family)